MGKRNFTRTRQQDRSRRDATSSYYGNREVNAHQEPRPIKLSKEELRARGEAALASYTRPITKCPPGETTT